uniref:Intraflagellar transport protein 57 homolog n=1 Tax=Timema cristinae TaxID=61476 RepID=A0A7R9CRC1_TIMCR|nr:unnamed protein product [Timema cristinae]
MSLEEEHVLADTSDAGPGLEYMLYVTMEELHDKLNLLNYDVEFVRDLKMKPLSRLYFVIPTNPGEQFYLFTSLAAWLIRKTNRQLEQPQEYDDPNSTIASILDNLRATGTSVNFPPNKLKQGCGQQAVFVLDRLADAALKSTSFLWHKPEPPVELDHEEDVPVEDESELLLERVEEDMAADYSDDEEETLLRIEDLAIQNIETQKPDEILESNTNFENWKLELERVIPQLKKTLPDHVIVADSRDWRSRLDQMQQHREGIDGALATARAQLDKLHTDISQTLEKMSSREKYLNTQLETYLVQYRSLQDDFSRVSTQYRQVSGGVTERSRTLAHVTEELESIKQEMEEWGTSMTDRTPLVNVKKCLSRMKEEVKLMDVRIGVLEHSLLQARLKDKSQFQQDISGLLQPLD